MRTQMIIDELTNRGYKVKAITVSKNNVKKEALKISVSNNTKMIVYLDSIPDFTSPKKIVDHILKDCNLVDVDLFRDKLMNAEWVKNHIKVALQRKTDEDIVKGNCMIPDVEMYLYVGDEEFSTKVHNKLLDNLHISVSDVWISTLKNLMQNTQIINMNEILPDLPYPVPMYVVTTRGQYRGAAAILNRTELHKLAHILETDELILLPSSIHEFIVVPYNNITNKDCTQMVKDINNEEVVPEEQLADHAYLYNVNTKSVTIL